MRTTVVAILVLAGFAAATFTCSSALGSARAPDAEDEVPSSPGQLQLQTDRVVVFKDGHALFVKTARGVADATGQVFTDEVPDDAVLGSFWATSDRTIRSMSAEWGEEVEVERSVDPAVTLLELLRANEGREVTLVMTDDSEALGTLVRVMDRPAGKQREAWTAVGSEAAEAPTSRQEVLPEGGQLVLFEASRGTTSALPLASIRAMRSTELATEITREFQTVSREKRLAFDLGPEAAGQSVEIELLYFRSGMTWIPTYRAQLEGSQADLSLQGELVNEAEDFVDAALDFVVGVPNFRFAGSLSPLALERTVRQTLQAAAPERMLFNDLSNANFAHQPSDWTPPAVGGTSSPPEVNGDVLQDLFVYSAGRRSSRRGARSAVPLWTQKARTRDVYTATLPAMQAVGRGPGELTRNEVWHQMDLQNPSNVPWTTGPLLFMDGQLPVAQDLLGYTPSGASTRVPLTKAVEVRAESSTKELSRDPTPVRRNNQDHVWVTREMTVRVTNFRDERSAVELDTTLPGKALEVSADGGAEETGRGGLNAQSTVRWAFEMKPGETREFAVTYETLVR